jgi:hypothetical protein
MQGHTTFNSQISQAIDDIKNTLTKITSFMSIQEKGKFSSQPEPNPRYGVHEVQNTQVEHANSVTILSSGNEVNKEIPTKVLEPKGNLETKDDNKPSKVEDVKERVYKPVAPFPQRLLTPKKGTTNQDVLEVFKQVKINIPLLDAIKQISSYSKFLKDLCTVKRKFFVQKNVFLIEQVSSIIQQQKIPFKHKDPGSPIIPCIIGDSKIDKALIDLGSGVNLLPYSVYEQLGLGELKPTKVL